MLSYILACVAQALLHNLPVLYLSSQLTACPYHDLFSVNTPPTDAPCMTQMSQSTVE